MAKPLNILIIEDSASDAELIAHGLDHSGVSFVFQRVETVSAMETALDAKSWDVIISDFRMPSFDALAALEILKRRRLDLPFIIVSGAIGEQQAVEAMKAGAHDYL